MAAIEEARKAAVAEQVANAAGKDAAGIAAMEAERIAGERAKYAATEQLMADHLARMQTLEDERKAQIQARLDIQRQYADAELSLLAGTGDALLAATVEGGAKGLKAAAKLASQQLKMEAIRQGILGAINLIPPPWNPLGNPMVAKLQFGLAAKAGAAAAVLGAMGGGGGGGGGQGLSASGAGSAPIASAPAMQQNTNVTVSNSFGLVGDQRAAAKLVVDSLGYAGREGMI